MSVGGGNSEDACDADATMALLRPVVQRLRLRGIPSVISAGNNYERNRTSFPACLGEMVSVAATSRTGVPSSYTSISASTDLFAPGGEFGECVISSVQTSTYDDYCGTSMAAPHVAGAIAALKTVRPTASAASVVNAIRATGPRILDSRAGGIHTKPRLAMNDALTRLISPVRPSNDNIASATAISLGASVNRFEGHTVGATREVGEQSHSTTSPGYATSWWRFRATSTGNVTISTLGSDFDTVLAVYRGTTHSSPRVATNNDAATNVRFSEVVLPVIAGQTYSIAVGGSTSVEQGQVFLTLRVPPANNNFVSARTVVVPASYSIGFAGNNTGADREPNEPTHRSVLDTTTVWFRFIAPSTGNFTIDTNGSNFDTVLAVYRGTSLGSLTRLALDDDSGIGVSSLVTFPVVAGQRYEVVVAGYRGETGSYRLFFTPPGIPFNSTRTLETASAE